MSFEIKYPFKENTIYCGDNLKILKGFPSEKVDLIYIDPPFFSNEDYEIIWNDGYELKAFEDRWKGGIQHYISWMKPRIEELYRILNNKGSFFLHCDAHANGHLRVLCDSIFKEANFQSEIIWRRTFTSKSTSKGLGKNLDTILYYTKTKEFRFNKIVRPLSREQIERDYQTEQGSGRIFTHNKLIKKGNAPKTLVFKDKGKITAKNGYRFIWNQETYEEKIKKNPEIVFWTKNGVPRFKTYLDEHTGVPIDNLWNDIPPLASRSRERTGYPTQKPESLLERIIRMSSNEGDLCLDCFCGCGSSTKVAKDLNRKFIAIDISPMACRLVAERIKYEVSEIIGMKYLPEEIIKLDPFMFQRWSIEIIGGIPNNKKTGDFGVDGFISNELGNNLPIQVKRNTKTPISRNTIDNFETVLRRENKDTGYIIGIDFSKGALEEIARVKNQEKLTIIPIKINEYIKSLL